MDDFGLLFGIAWAAAAVFMLGRTVLTISGKKLDERALEKQDTAKPEQFKKYLLFSGLSSLFLGIACASIAVSRLVPNFVFPIWAMLLTTLLPIVLGLVCVYISNKTYNVM